MTDPLTICDLDVDILLFELFPQLSESLQWTMFTLCKIMYTKLRRKVRNDVLSDLTDRKKSTCLRLSNSYDERGWFLHKMCLSNLTYQVVPIDKIFIRLCEQNNDEMIIAMCERGDSFGDKLTPINGLLILLKNCRCDIVQRLLLLDDILFYVTTEPYVRIDNYGDTDVSLSWHQIQEISLFPRNSELLEKIFIAAFKTNDICLISRIIDYFDRFGIQFITTTPRRILYDNEQLDNIGYDTYIDMTKLYYVCIIINDNPRLLDYIHSYQHGACIIIYYNIILSYKGKHTAEFLAHIDNLMSRIKQKTIPPYDIKPNLYLNIHTNIDILKYMLKKFNNNQNNAQIIDPYSFPGFHCKCANNRNVVRTTPVNQDAADFGSCSDPNVLSQIANIIHTCGKPFNYFVYLSNCSNIETIMNADIK